MDFSSLFASGNFAHFNGGTLSRTPLAILEYAEQLRRADEINPTEGVFHSAEQLWKAQLALAPFFGVDPNDFYLRANVTDAVNDFLFGLEFKSPESQAGATGEFLATGLEYGAVANGARVRAAQLGFDYRVAQIPLGPDVTAEEMAQAITGAFTERTRLLLLSHVATGTGAILPVKQIAARARERGIITVVDGAHAIGALPLDIPSLQVDFYGGNLHKWFMGPRGTAFGWVRPGLKVDWKFGGWASFTKPKHLEAFGGNDEAARRLFQGTIDTAPFRALEKVIEFWATHGADALRAAQQKKRDLAASLAHQYGWERISPRDPELLGPLVAFRKPKEWPDLLPVDLANRLYYESRVQIALPVVQGEMLLRLSPGLYTSTQEIQEGMDRLRRFR